MGYTALYEEVKINLPENMMYNFQQLIDFNKAISTERLEILKVNLSRLNVELAEINLVLMNLEQKKSTILKKLTVIDSYSKFKDKQKKYAHVEAEIQILQEKLNILSKTSELYDELSKISTQINNTIEEIQKEIEKQKHSKIRKIYNDIIKIILNTNAIISVTRNSVGNVDFEANIQNPKDLTITAENYGKSYRQLMCIAFDLTILIYYSSDSFFRFAYHDGALEGLDDRKKIIFIDFIREICKKDNLQYIMTIIDSDLPKDMENKTVHFSLDEICLKLHDKDDSGKLFEKSF